MAERPLHRGEVGKNIGVIEFDVVEDDGIGAVVDEFAALVEERGVVFVALDEEVFPLPHPRAAGEIVGDAADQEARRQARRFHDPGEQRGCGRLAVRARDHDGVTIAKETVMHQLGQRTDVEAFVERALDFRVAALHRVADHNEIGRGSRFDSW